jgi:hypothetical protein
LPRSNSRTSNRTDPTASRSWNAASGRRCSRKHCPLRHEVGERDWSARHGRPRSLRRRRWRDCLRGWCGRY